MHRYVEIWECRQTFSVRLLSSSWKYVSIVNCDWIFCARVFRLLWTIRSTQQCLRIMKLRAGTKWGYWARNAGPATSMPKWIYVSLCVYAYQCDRNSHQMVFHVSITTWYSIPQIHNIMSNKVAHQQGTFHLALVVFDTLRNQNWCCQTLTFSSAQKKENSTASILFY